MTSDAELLRFYAETGSEDAFTEVVRRHLPLVYSTALRQLCGNQALAQDVAQSVFIDLARKATSVASREVLAGWLYRSTRMAAAKALRSEQRRRAREQRAVIMQETSRSAEPAVNRSELGTVLDEAMDRLGTEDRNAVLLRFFQNLDFKTVGTALGISEDAARMRVNRALSRLHGLMAARGVTLSAAALGAALCAETASAASPSLVASITAGALATSATKTGAGLTLFKLMTLTKAKLAVMGALAVADLAVIHQQTVQVREQNTTLRVKLERVRTAHEEALQQWEQLSNQAGESPEAELNRLRAKAVLLEQQVQAARKRFRTAGTSTRRPNRAPQADDSASQSDLQRSNEHLREFMRMYPSVLQFASNNPTASFLDANGQMNPEITRLTPLLDWDDLEFNIPDSATLLALCVTNREEVIAIGRQPLLTDNGGWFRHYLLANGSAMSLWTATPTEIYHSRAEMPRRPGEASK